jgi:uncharacterized protein YdaT
MAKKDVHVVPRGNGWAVEKNGSQRASKVTETQREAIAAGKKIAEREKSELVVHGENGRIREKNSYGNDPSPPKG